MKFDDLPEEVKKFKDKIGEAELLHLWDRPIVHLGGFSLNQLWQSGNPERRREVLALLKHYSS